MIDQVERKREVDTEDYQEKDLIYTLIKFGTQDFKLIDSNEKDKDKSEEEIEEVILNVSW